MDSPFGALVGFFAFLSFLLETQLGKSCWVLDFAVICFFFFFFYNLLCLIISLAGDAQVFG